MGYRGTSSSFLFLMAFFCVSQPGEFKNFWPKKLRKKTVFPVVFPFDFLLRFLPFLFTRSLKTTLKYFLKSDLKISQKKLKKSTVVPLPRFFIFKVPLEKIDGPLPVHLRYLRPTYLPKLCVSWFFLGTFFGRFSVRGVQKHYKKRFAKHMCQKVCKPMDKKKPRFFSSICFITFLSVSRREELENTAKEVIFSPRHFFGLTYLPRGSLICFWRPAARPFCSLGTGAAGQLQLRRY
jgi:hypothetical protein